MKGGAGKTTLAVHIAGMLAGKSGKQTLLIDCDPRPDAWEFFAKSEPQDRSIKFLENAPDVWWNPPKSKGDRFESLGKLEYKKYQYVVIDTDSPPEDCFTMLVNLLPSIILVPIAESQSHSIKFLPKFFKLLTHKVDVERASGNDYNPIVKIVPLGLEIDEINSRFDITNISDIEIKIVSPMRSLAAEARKSLENRTFMWEERGLEDTKDYFYNLINLITRIQ
jgi:chromosome partitioning protein